MQITRDQGGYVVAAGVVLMTLIGKTIRCPVAVSQSGLIRIVGDQRHCESNCVRWRLLAIDPESSGAPFEVSETEVQNWLDRFGEVRPD